MREGGGREEQEKVVARKNNVSGEGLNWYGTGRAGRIFLSAIMQEGGRGTESQSEIPYCGSKHGEKV